MITKKRPTKLFATTGVLLLICSPSPVVAEDTAPTTAGDLKVFEISMNDSNPLQTLKEQIIEDRSTYDAAVNMTYVDMDSSSIAVDTFDRTKTGIQNVNVSVVVDMKDSSSTSTDYAFNQTASIRMLQPDGPYVILKSDEVSIDLGSAFDYSNNIGYISSNDGKLPAIKESDNVDVNTEGTYTCHLQFIDESGKKTNVSYQVTVKKPEEVVRAEEEAARLAAEKAAAEAAAQKAREEAARNATGGVISVDDSSLASAAGSIDMSLAPAGFDINHPTGDVGNNYASPQCTWWAYVRRHQLGLPVGSNFGNGNMWANSARALGYWVDNTPRMVGDIMVFQGGQASSSWEYGHVAIVEEIYADGSVRVSEMGTGFTGYFCSNRVFYDTANYQFIHY